MIMGLGGWFGKTESDLAADVHSDLQEHKLAAHKDTVSEPSQNPGVGLGASDMVGGGGDKPAGPPKVHFTKAPTPNVSALNSQIVQAVQFTNTETSNYAGELVVTPPEMMVSTTTGLAVQDAKNYMNAIMQIAVAAQAVAIKKAAEGPEPVSAIKEIPLLLEIQNMVTQSIAAYSSVSTAAGQSAATVISDLKSG
ncbi:hypothetical protein [Roseibium algae]|uniref:Uncharacterized protein n=1 Tax=Roseibium algae TaxID=3123038 RepID=A0ABU8TMF8_9HYPH